MSIITTLLKFKSALPPNVKLIAVSKTKPVEVIKEAYDAGQRIFGENKAQDLTAKFPLLPVDIEWHFIGHLQSNKVKHIVPFVSLIHSVDSIKLLGEINKHALKNQRIVDCLLQFHISTEEAKFGLSLKEAKSLIACDYFKTLNNIRITGVMGMATFTEDKEIIRNEFKQLKGCFTELKKSFYANIKSFKEISMGMSDDYQIALEEGSTIIRIGSAIFGARNY
ncbi:MAG: YggS family pyridoxal phosphate-dependent enzyme [Bacteroidetes bacterium]|nr:YggS family pyridoxal phosphate-dependent enzyme [Bacteroidota bacterium]